MLALLPYLVMGSVVTKYAWTVVNERRCDVVNNILDDVDVIIAPNRAIMLRRRIRVDNVREASRLMLALFACLMAK